MPTSATHFDCEAIRGTFRQWQAEQEPLDAQLRESLAALAAYQSHLDGWQQQLGRERDELVATREHFDRDRAAGEANQSQLSADLNAAREKIAALTTSLLARTEELRTLDNRRAEVVTELELVRAREKELKNSMEELKTAREQERAQRSEEIEHLRELLERRLDGNEPEYRAAAPDRSPSIRPSETNNGDDGANPVLTSVMEQFGKLRQQRALDRPTFKKAR